MGVIYDFAETMDETKSVMEELRIKTPDIAVYPKMCINYSVYKPFFPFTNAFDLEVCRQDPGSHNIHLGGIAYLNRKTGESDKLLEQRAKGIALNGNCVPAFDDIKTKKDYIRLDCGYSGYTESTPHESDPLGGAIKELFARAKKDFQ